MKSDVEFLQKSGRKSAPKIARVLSVCGVIIQRFNLSQALAHATRSKKACRKQLSGFQTQIILPNTKVIFTTSKGEKMRTTSQHTNPTQNINSGEKNRPETRISPPLLNSNKIIPRYEGYEREFLTGGGIY